MEISYTQEFVLYVALAAWLLVCALNFLGMVCAALLPAHTPCFDGFRIRIPPDARMMLEDDEMEAVLQHEREHRRLMHPWKNLLRACLFWHASERTIMAQELRADDAVRDKRSMARAVRRLSSSRRDILRVARLEALSKGISLADDYWLEEF